MIELIIILLYGTLIIGIWIIGKLENQDKKKLIDAIKKTGKKMKL